MSIWAQTSVQRLLALLVCCWTQTDGWFSPQLLPTNSSDSIRYIFRGPMQKPYVGHYDGIAMPTCFSVKYQALPSITFCMKPLQPSTRRYVRRVPSARRMTPRRRTRNQNWRASTRPSEPVVRGDLVPSSDIFQEVPDQEPISKMMIDSNEMILGCEQWSNMVVVSREILYNK